MNFFQILATAFSTVLGGSASVTIKGYTVSATLATTPVHFTFAAALVAISKVLAGATGTFQSGDISISIAKAV
jgi:hypothetical protein